MTLYDSFSSSPQHGSSISVQARLKIEWISAIWKVSMAVETKAKRKIAFADSNSVSQTTVPMMLKLRCTTAARRAFLFVPTEDSIAVTQVPMF